MMFRRLQQKSKLLSLTTTSQPQPLILIRPLRNFSAQQALAESRTVHHPLLDSILQKQTKGRQLAMDVTQSVPLDKMDRDRRYEVFINKMTHLYSAKKRFESRMNFSRKRMRGANFLFRQPVQAVLSEYSKLTKQGFNCELLANSLEDLNGVLQARGNKPKVWTDYETHEMDGSWRMDKVAEDILFGLTSEHAFFSPHNQGRVSRLLGEINYKNTEIINQWLNSLLKTLNSDQGVKITPPPSFESVVYGGMEGFNPRYYVFQGFQSNEEFNEHLQTLMLFKQEPAKQEVKHDDAEVAALLNALKNVVDSAQELGELTTNQHAAIESLRQQYFKLRDAQDQNEFLQQNKYIVYDMLELQELLVKGGYIDPDEALQGLNETLDSRMERASSVFYDYISALQPEVLSPQNQEFLKAQKAGEHKLPNLNHEEHNFLRLGSLSDILVGLSEQAQSQRRDARGKDYPTDYYEELLHNEEKINGHALVNSFEQQNATKHKTPYVQMETSYLNGWRDFKNISSQIITQHIDRLIDEEQTIEGLLKGLNALSACKFEAREQRDRIMAKIYQKLSADESVQIDTQACIDGLNGIGNCAYVAPRTKYVLHQLVEHQLKNRKFDYYQRVDLLHGIALCSSKSLSILKAPLMRRAMDEISDMQYGAIDNDLNLKQFDKLNDVYKTLKFNKEPTFSNKVLDSALMNGDQFRCAYFESSAESYDPLKSKVTAALAKSMHESDLARVKFQQEFNEYVKDITLKPDILTGYRGKNCAIYVLPNRHMMHDTYTADGRRAHLMSLSKDIHNISVPVDRVIDYDLQTYRLNVRDDFSLQSLLGNPEKNSLNRAHDNFVEFVGNFTRSMDPRQYSGNMDIFVEQLAEYFKLSERAEMVHEPAQKITANNELKLSLLKLNLLHQNTLTPAEKTIIDNAVGGNRTFQEITHTLKKELITKHSVYAHENRKEWLDWKFDFSWQGTRLSVEIPNNDPDYKKEIGPELISPKFIKHGSYHHYDDWKDLQKKCYDQFNLMELKENEFKVNHDPMDYNRIVPKGIYPLPNHKRIVMEPFKAMSELPSGADKFNKFEKDPMAYMVKQELEIAKGMQEITPEVSMITNLQNMKYGLLSDSSDAEICEKLLKMNFIDRLIESHLQSTSENASEATLLPRDPAAFRKYHTSIPQPQSLYNQYWLKEAAKKKHIQELLDKVTTLQRQGRLEEASETQKQLDYALLKEERENEDCWSLSSSIKQYITINVDVKSLGVLDRPTQAYKNESISDADFLERERCLAESRLIKQKILYDIHEGNQLSENQKKYLAKWKELMAQTTTINEECMVPTTPTKISIKQLHPRDLERLNTIPRVELDIERHGNFALSDLVLEIGLVLDSQTVRAVELTYLQEMIKEEWQLGNEFRLFQHRNKEIDNVVSKYEEIAYRSAGCFNAHDKEALTKMFSVVRGVDLLDKRYLQSDINSLYEFMDNVNGYDNRIKLLELWLQRKENEINSRMVDPTPALLQTDMTINNRLEREYTPARQKLLGKITGQNYEEMSSDQLHTLVEDICTRLNMFQRDYPGFMPHAVRAIFEHPNLTRTDRTTLDAYCKMFKLDWRLDTDIENKDKFMSSNPIYLRKEDRSTLDAHPATVNESAIADIKRACKPYLQDLVTKIINL